MRASRTGLALVIVYLAITVVLVVYGLYQTSAGDPKGGGVLVQIPIVFTHAAAWGLGLLPSLEALPIPIAYVAFLIPNLLVVYLVGWLLDALVALCKR